MLPARCLLRIVPAFYLLLSVMVVGSARLAFSQTELMNPTSRVLGQIDETNLVSLKGYTHPLAQPKFDEGTVSDSFPMRHMYLQLRRSPAQETALNKLVIDIQNPQSPNYHHWIAAGELGKLYGPASQDIDTVERWLTSYGMQVKGVSKSRLTIDVSGTAGQLRQAFHTEIHRYNVNGHAHIANASDPQIPAALSQVIAGFNSLNNFMPVPAVRKPKANFSFPCDANCPAGFAGYEQYDEAPADLATIYNVTPLYKATQPITGKGQTVVVLEVTDIKSADVASFRKAFGLSGYAGKFIQIHPGCSDPGINGAEGEAALDAEWAGAVAPDANVELASCGNSETNFGAFIAAQNLLDLSSPPHIMSLSYLSCEASLGPGGNLYMDELWQQAALEGVSVFVAAGDGGPAGCDDFNSANYAVDGIAANGLASTPYDTATGATDFLDTSRNDNSKYWSTSNTAAGKSAISYIPESPWNDSCASSVLYKYAGYSSGVQYCNNSPFLDIIAGSGAPSFVYAKPWWQKNLYGNGNDGVRDLPDVSLFASNGFWFHAILFCMSDPNEGGVPCNYSVPEDAFYNSAGGTSFTAPQFASIQALINQKAGGPQGNPAPIYYDLGKAEYGSQISPNKVGLSECGSTIANNISWWCTFHDVEVGNNNVPCYGTNNCYGSVGLSYGVLSTSDWTLHPAYTAHGGWDFSTGLGTVNVTNLVNRWH